MYYGARKCDCKPIKEEYEDIKNPDCLYSYLSHCWNRNTCAPRFRNKWSVENMTLGQCSITAFLAQDIFGGKVYGIERPNGAIHCYNVVGECVFDLASEQFGDEKLDYSTGVEQFREAEYHFGNGEKQARYELLKTGLKTEIQRQKNGYYEEINPIDKKDDILELLKEYNPVVHTNKETDFDWLDDDCVSIIAYDEDGNEKIYVDIEGEFTVGFGGWHSHVNPYLMDYEQMIGDIHEILENKRVAIVVWCDEEWMGSFSVSADELDRASLIDSVKQLLSAKEFRDKMRLKGIVIECSFFDKGKSISYEVLGTEI